MSNERRHDLLQGARGLGLIRRLMGVKLGRLTHYSPRPLGVPPHYTRTRATRNLPKISIVTPSYNQGHFLERTLRSVIDQQYPRLEYIVQDGRSSDQTTAILARYARQLAHCESAPDNGQTQAINRGLRRATGEILAYLNSDDLLLPGALHYVGQFFEDHPECDVAYGHRILIDDADADIGRWIVPPHDDTALIWENYVPQETLFWRRRIWDKIGASLDESFACAMDWDLLLRFRAAGATFARLPRFLGAFRVHPEQKTQRLKSTSIRSETLGLLERSHGPRSTNVYRVGYTDMLPYWIRHVVCHRLYWLGMLRY